MAKPYDRDLHQRLVKEHGEKEGNSRYEKYRNHIPKAYVGKKEVVFMKLKKMAKKARHIHAVGVGHGRVKGPKNMERNPVLSPKKK